MGRRGRTRLAGWLRISLQLMSSRDTDVPWVYSDTITFLMRRYLEMHGAIVAELICCALTGDPHTLPSVGLRNSFHLDTPSKTSHDADVPCV